jgi:hypothetical protein
MRLLILKSGDVERNHGPGVSPNPSFSSINETSISDDFFRIDNLIYFTCLNINKKRGSIRKPQLMI